MCVSERETQNFILKFWEIFPMERDSAQDPRNEK